MTIQNVRGDFAANEDSTRDTELKFSGAILAGDNALLHRDDTSTPLPLLPTIQPAFPIGGDDGSLNFTLPVFAHPNVPALGAHGDFGGQIVFVDPGVRDLQTVLAGIKPGMDVVLLDPHQDALDQIAETLSGHHGVTAVHIIADGKGGEIDFSSGAFNIGNLTTGSHASDLAAIGKAMSANGDLMIWSCNTGAGMDGQAFIDALAQHTGADVAASTGITGAGGNWILEAHTGPIEATVPLTDHGIHQVDNDGLDLSALTIIFPVVTETARTIPPHTGTYNYYDTELGFSDGATGGTTTVDNIFPGLSSNHGAYGGALYNSSDPTGFTVLGDRVVFIATSADGRELWSTDGTTAGTYEIANINAGAANAFSTDETTPFSRVVIGSEMFFAAQDATHGIELWTTNGTLGNATMVKDIDPGAASSGVYDLVSFNGDAFFVANDGTTGGSGSYVGPVRELWKSDGSSLGTTEVFTVPEGSTTTYASGVYDLTVAGSHLFFVGHGGDDVGHLYVSDGTPGGTALLDTGSTTLTDIRDLANINGTLFFAASDGSHGQELWESDGTQSGTFMVKDIDPGATGSAPFDFVVTANGEIFFAADDGTNGTELWETDGTAGNAQMVANINANVGAGSDPNWLTVIGNEVFFTATDGTHGSLLYESNGTTTQTVDSLTTPLARNPTDLQDVNGTLYFTADDTSGKLALFKFDGTNIDLVHEGYSGFNSSDTGLPPGQGSNIGKFVFLGGGVVTQGEPDTFTTDELTAVTGQNLFSDNGNGPDTGTSLSIDKVNDSAGNVGSQFALADGSLLTVHSDGTFTWDPNGKFEDLPAAGSGADPTALPNAETFTYHLAGASSDTTVTINVTGVDNNDTVIGTAGTDTLNPGVGNDIVQALGGADTINMGANLTAADQIDGGTGNDTVNLNGDYTGGNAVVFNATTMVNVEDITLANGHSYNLTTADATVAAAATLLVDGSQLDDAQSLTFNGSAETDGSFVVIGGAGNDTITGGAGADIFKMQNGGTDTVHGGGGDDSFYFDGTLTSSDTVDGGSGNDTLILGGDYTGGNALTMSATTMTGVETLNMHAGFSYDITTNDANVASGQTLLVRGPSLGAGDSITFNGSAETNGSFVFTPGAGNDNLTGGAGNDRFNLITGGNDTAHGGGGNDFFSMGGSFDAADAINGGPGRDVLNLDGDYTGGNAVVMAAGTMTGIEVVRLAAGDSYDLTTNDANVGAGAILAVDGQNLGASDALTFDGSAETDGKFHINGGAGNDTLTGGAGGDIIKAGDGANTIEGGGGADHLSGGSGADTFVYAGASDSTSTGYDTITGFDASSDFFHVIGDTVNAIGSEVTSGTLRTVNFDANLTSAIGAGQLGAHDAVLFTPNHGNLAGQTFLIVDVNGTAGYQAGQDLVIDLSGATNLGSLATANFI